MNKYNASLAMLIAASSPGHALSDEEIQAAFTSLKGDFQRIVNAHQEDSPRLRGCAVFDVRIDRSGAVPTAPRFTTDSDEARELFTEMAGSIKEHIHFDAAAMQEGEERFKYPICVESWHTTSPLVAPPLDPIDASDEDRNWLKQLTEQERKIRER